MSINGETRENNSKNNVLESNVLESIWHKEAVVSTCFPDFSIMACSFDKDLFFRIGSAIGKEALANGFRVAASIDLNVNSNSQNTTALAEDPILNGELGASFINGVQSNGVACELSNFILGSRQSNLIIDNRSLKEIYLKPFEVALSKSSPKIINVSTANVNHDKVGESKEFVSEFLRSNCQHDGVIVAPSGTNIKNALCLGVDIVEPKLVFWSNLKKEFAQKNTDNTTQGNAKEYTNENAIENAKRHIEKLYKETANLRVPCDLNEHNELSKIALRESAVLIKNDGTLPINHTSIAIIGEPTMGYANAFIESDLVKSFEKFATVQKVQTIKSLKDKNIETVVIFASGDKVTDKQLATIKSKKIVVVCDKPTIFDRANAILYVGTVGQNIDGIAEILFGVISPSGRMTITQDTYLANEMQNTYKHSIYVGYRYFVTASRKMRLPFGYGLSYTQFEYFGVKANKSIYAGEKVTFKCTIKNVGEQKGKECILLFLESPRSKVFKEKRKLVAFEKIELDVGESKRIKLEISPQEFAYFNVPEGIWHIERGIYKLCLAKDSQTIIQEISLQVLSPLNILPPEYALTAPEYYNLSYPFKVSDKSFEKLLS